MQGSKYQLEITIFTHGLFLSLKPPRITEVIDSPLIMFELLFKFNDIFDGLLLSLSQNNLAQLKRNPQSRLRYGWWSKKAIILIAGLRLMLLLRLFGISHCQGARSGKRKTPKNSSAADTKKMVNYLWSNPKGFSKHCKDHDRSWTRRSRQISCWYLRFLSFLDVKNIDAVPLSRRWTD